MLAHDSPGTTTYLRFMNRSLIYIKKNKTREVTTKDDVMFNFDGIPVGKEYHPL